MTRQEQIERITRACVAANPDAAYWGLPKGGDTRGARPPRLADVLLAIEDKWRSMLTASYDFGAGRNRLPEGALLYQIVSKYHLRKDTLTDQSDECIAFLSDLLAPSV